LEACPLRKSDISLLDFVVNRFFMKLFQTNNIDIVNYCHAQFEFDLPSTVVEKRKKFVAKYRSCESTSERSFSGLLKTACAQQCLRCD